MPQPHWLMHIAAFLLCGIEDLLIFLDADLSHRVHPSPQQWHRDSFGDEGVSCAYMDTVNDFVNFIMLTIDDWLCTLTVLLQKVFALVERWRADALDDMFCLCIRSIDYEVFDEPWATSVPSLEFISMPTFFKFRFV